MSSTLKIISAASVADTKAYSFTLKHSVIPSSLMLSTCPVNMFNPASLFPLAISLLKFYTISALSYPALSAIMVGSCFKALAKASIARAYLPSTVLASSSTARLILISILPPPYITL